MSYQNLALASESSWSAVFISLKLFAVACADSGRVAPARADCLLTRRARRGKGRFILEEVKIVTT